ncbi:hypothetical protein L5515_007911 [Caenorhabditis briggsae]|uniref:Uncharacterized protein n=1 Tax=Caenorhabditis briggsae TaxID=6238 RepID=A0AAE9F4G9_CAEBR|nr:hypothetical protein L5515_007911 [Caenorhabditis briggsae]
MSFNPDNSTEIFNNVELTIENHDYNELRSTIVITFFVICILVSCGSWCIYAAGKISEEANVYHFENEFKPDNEESKSKFKRKAAGICEIEIENGSYQTRTQTYLTTLARSFMIWKE